MDHAIVGREGILDQVWRALSAGDAVMLEGPAGIGKTAVWRQSVTRAREAGWLVLSCAPTESEATLAFAALADLLEPLADNVGDLPKPQRTAAEVVLLAAQTHDVVDERAVGAVARSLLDGAIAGAERPVLVAIDDAPWLDPPSERALRYALRRLTSQPAVLMSRRTEGPESGGPPLRLDDRFQVNRIHLPALGVGALHHIVRARLGKPLSRPLLARIARDANGNPLLAIEMARAVLRLPQPPRPADDLPVASSMQQLLADALATLPDSSRDAIRLAALLAVPTVADLTAAGVAPAALDPAEEAGLLVVGPSRVEFAHPMFASAVRASIPSGVRRRLHSTLAEAVADPDERARQLAWCTTEPDAAVAVEVAESAARQRARGAPALAGDLYQRAAELTPAQAVADRDRRLLDGVRCRFDSGDYAAAATAADEAVGKLTGDPLAQAWLLRAMVAWSADDMGLAAQAGERALAAATRGTTLLGRIHAHMSLFQDAPAAAKQHAEAAIELLRDSAEDRPLMVSSLLHLFHHEVRAGLPVRIGLLERALELEEGQPSWLAGTIPAIWWKAIDDHDRARARLHDMLERATANGDEPWQHELLTHLGETELLAGRFDAAAAGIAAARELGEQLGTGLVGETWLAGTLDAYRGRLTEAAAVAESGLRRASDLDDAWCRRIHLQLAGFVALSAGRMDQAAAVYRELATVLDSSGLGEPIALRFEPDWIEACIGAGDLDTATSVLDRLARRHAHLARPWTTLGLARSRVLLDSAAGRDTEPALAQLTAARHGVPPDVLPLERARCLLAAGLAHRRARRKRAARQALSTAAAEFETLGAAAFAQRCRAELARTGGATTAPTELTPTEERVARLAASGQTNRAIAEALFISPKTVEANLARIYRKLGVSSRAQLGAVIASHPVSGPP